MAALAIEHGASEAEAIGAVLHDVVEDQGVTREILEDLFGVAVADIVIGCSDTDQIPKPPWRARKEAYVAHVRGASASVRLVSMSDKLHNARSILADQRALVVVARERLEVTCARSRSGARRRRALNVGARTGTRQGLARRRRHRGAALARPGCSSRQGPVPQSRGSAMTMARRA